MKLKKFNQLFEADLKDTLPDDYIKDVRRRAAPHMGGPSRQDFREAMELMDEIFSIQEGNEEELTQIGIDILQEHYARMLEDIELDVKIVAKDDEEKLDMTKRMQNEEDKVEPKYPEFEVPVTVPLEEIDRRKIVNNIMQGEAQNVHSMMYSAKAKIDAIDPALLDLYIRHLELNRKFDWDENRPDMSQWIKDHPEMANAVETKYPEGDEEGGEGEEEQGKVKIIARVLDLPMIIHETVKAIYELMAAKAIPSDKTMATALLKLTDSLKDEEEDIKYGPFIAADLRDYLNDLLQRTTDESIQMIPNLREFIFSKMMELPTKIFVELIKCILLKDNETADFLLMGDKKRKLLSLREVKQAESDDLIYQAILDATGEVDVDTIGVNIPDEDNDKYYSRKDLLGDGDGDDDVIGGDEEDNELINYFKKPTKPEVDEKPEPKKKKWVEYGQGELMFMLNQAMDEGNWDLVREIQPFIKDLKP